MTSMRLGFAFICVLLCYLVPSRQRNLHSSNAPTPRDMKAVYFVLLWAALSGAAMCLLSRMYIYVDVPMNWTDAQNYCRKNYIDLMTITSQRELEHFNGGVNASLQTWIGLRKALFFMGYTQWSDGNALGLTKWAENEPSNKTTDRCVYTLGGVWYDCLCSSLLQFSCYTWEPQVIVVQEMKTWDEALKYCRTFYTDLISLPRTVDQAVSRSMTSTVQTPIFWTGLRFLDGSWFWLNEEPMGNFMSSCPAPSLRCGAKQTNADVFENRDCEEKMNFVCYQVTM